MSRSMSAVLSATTVLLLFNNVLACQLSRKYSCILRITLPCVLLDTWHIYYYVPSGSFLCIGSFCSFVRESIPVLSVAGQAGGPREHGMQVWALAEVRGTCSGS